MRWMLLVLLLLVIAGLIAVRPWLLRKARSTGRGIRRDLDSRR